MDRVDGAERLERVFGSWPSFHDAEVVSMELDRARDGSAPGPTLRFSVHVFEKTDPIEARGGDVLQNHVLVSFALYTVEVHHLEGFNQQNVLSSLELSRTSDADRPLRVVLHSLYGVSAEFQCARAEVESVEPYASQGAA